MPTELPEVLELEPRVFGDSRGFFMESYNYERFSEAGIPTHFVQDNHSRSVKGVIRGLHYQLMPGQAKLVRCILGEIVDVVVDIRRNSPRFGKSIQRLLTAENKRLLYVPVGFAHGFCVLSDVAEVEYKVDTYYTPELERGIRFDDPQLAIQWPVEEPLLSSRDTALPLLAEADFDFVYEQPQA